MNKLFRSLTLASLFLSALASSSSVLAQTEPLGGRDRSPIYLSIEPTSELTDSLKHGIGTQGTARLHLIAFADTPPLLLRLQIAGGVMVNQPADWHQAEPSEALIADLPVRDQFAISLDGLERGKRQSIDLPVSFPAEGYGYILANVRSSGEGKLTQISESYVLYSLANSQRVYLSSRSVLDLDTQKLQFEALQSGAGEANEDEIQRLKRGGAKVDKVMRPPAMESGAATAPPAEMIPTDDQSVAAPQAAPARAAPPQEATALQPSPAPTAAAKSITVSGRIAFTDVSNGIHPVQNAIVEVWDQEVGQDDLVKAVSTDDDGRFSATVNNNDGDGTGRDLYVVALAKGQTVRVVEYDPDNPDDPNAQVWAIDSLPAERNTPNGTQLTINLTASNDLSHPNNVAFEAYAAANALSRYLPSIGEKLPALVTIKYPVAGDGSWYLNSKISLAGTDVHDWDNIQHEYGHHIQEIFNLSGSPGGPHALGENLCISHGKQSGLLLAWGEAWPTFFAVLAQKEMDLGSWKIPNVGDTLYTDTKPGGDDLEYNLEVGDGALHGEGDELSIQEALWDLYDPDKPGDDGEPWDNGVSLPPRTLWEVAEQAKAHTLSDFNQALANGRSEAEKIAYGAIYAHHKIGSELTAPEDKFEFPVSTAPTFEWTGNLGCDVSDDTRQFSIRFYDETDKELFYDSPWQKESRFAIAQAKAAILQAHPGARWVVVSKGESEPKTGIYYGESRILYPKAGEPEAAGSAAPANERVEEIPELFWLGWSMR